jgi:hypothetical protein
MPNLTIYNLHSTPIVVSGGYYVATIGVGKNAEITVPDAQEFLDDERISTLVDGGYILVEYSSSDSEDRPLMVYTSTTLPAANKFTAGSMVWNSTTRKLLVSDGSSWSQRVEGGSVLLTAAASDISAYRFVGIDTSGDLVTSPDSGERFAGVSDEAISSGSTGRVVTGGKAKVMASADLTANEELVAVPGGFAASYAGSPISLGTAVAGADASDDIDQGLTPDQVQVVCGGDETGNTVIVYGKNNAGGAYTTETITLGTAGTYTSTITFSDIYCLETTAASTGTIDIQDVGTTSNFIPQIGGATAARKYGAIEPDVSTDPEGHEVQIRAGAANAFETVLFGTDYAGNTQAEVVTMNGTNWVNSTKAYRSLDFVFIGADNTAWNAGGSSQYDQQVEANEKREIRAWTTENAATPGTPAECLVLPQNQFVVQGESPVIFYAGKYSGNPGGATDTLTIPDLQATDIVKATMNARTNAQRLILAQRTAADTLTLTWAADPGAGTEVSVVVFRP